MTIPHCHEWADQLRSADKISGVDNLGGFACDIDLTSPCITAAIHSGHNVRNELLPLMSITDEVRFFEEDPGTDRMIKKSPGAVWGLDSRTEYDLNRPANKAVPVTKEMFWGTEVYSKRPDDAMISRSMEKYDAFYQFMGSLVTVLLERFGFCVIYDLHAYNIGRQVEKGHTAPPTFNIGTEQLDRRRWESAIDAWISELKKITIPGHKIRVAENEVFFGRGNFCQTLTKWDERILVLPTEVSKIYMNEKTGEFYEDIVASLAHQLGSAVKAHEAFFSAEPARKKKSAGEVKRTPIFLF